MVAYIPIVPRPGCTSSLSRVNYLRYTVDNVLLPLIHLIKLVHLLAIVVTPTRLATLTGFEPPPTHPNRLFCYHLLLMQLMKLCYLLSMYYY